MAILLDEQIDVRMKDELSPFSVFTIQDKGWLGIKNGVLRERLNQEQFSFFVTADKNLPFQQNLTAIDFIIILLDTPTLLWQHQQMFVPKLIGILETPPAYPVKLVHISVEGISKGRKIEQLKNLIALEEILFV